MPPMLVPRPALWLRAAQFGAGLFAFGVAIALMIRSGLGLGPWDAFHVGIHLATGISVGMASALVGVAIVAGTLTLGVRPGVGTLGNMVLVGVFIDLALPFTPAAPGWGWALGYYLVALGLMGLGTGLYIGAGFGKGPRDGLMIVFCERSGWPVRRVRTLIEVSVLALGWAMGGPIGLGTLLFTLSAGPAAQWGLGLFGVLPSTVPAPPAPLAEEPLAA